METPSSTLAGHSLYAPLSAIEKQSLRLAEIRGDISTRLRPVNAGMESVMFEAMIDDMSQLQFSAEKRSAQRRS